MHFTQFRPLNLNTALRQGQNWVKCIFNNRRIGKDATKPRTLGLLGNSEIFRDQLHVDKATNFVVT